MLFLTTQLPYPPFSGGLIKSWRLISSLAAHYDVSLMCPLKGNDHQHVLAFQSHVDLKGFDGEPFEVERTPSNWLSSFVKGKTLNEYRGYNVELEQRIHAELKHHDAVFVDHYEMMQYVPASYSGKVILHTHNAEYVMWKRFASLEKNLAKKWAMQIEAKRIAKAELRACEQADLIFAAPNDGHELKAIGADSTRFETTYHLGNDELLEQPKVSFEKTSKHLLFIGTLSWEANLDGLVWFIENVWPAVKAAEPDLRFYIVGKNPPARLRNVAKAHRQIILTGFVEDTGELYASSRVLVVPLRFGSGIKVKVLDAMYRGIPCVTTPIGVEGLKAQHEREMMIAEGAEAFAKHTVTLLHNKTAWERLQKHSRQTAKANYTWSSLLKHHHEALRRTLTDAASEQPLQNKIKLA